MVATVFPTPVGVFPRLTASVILRAGLPHARGGVSVIKYAMRQGKKDGTDDAGKAQHYAQKLAEVLGNG